MRGILIIGIIVFIFILIFGILIFSNPGNDSEKEIQDTSNLNSETESNSELNKSIENELTDIKTSEDVFSLIDESVNLLG